jgi:hypothetical protein
MLKQKQQTKTQTQGGRFRRVGENARLLFGSERVYMLRKSPLFPAVGFFLA